MGEGQNVISLPGGAMGSGTSAGERHPMQSENTSVTKHDLPRMVENAVLCGRQETDGGNLAFMPPRRTSSGMWVVCYLPALLHVLLAAIEAEYVPETFVQYRLSIEVVGDSPHPSPLRLPIWYKHLFRNSEFGVVPGYAVVNAQAKVAGACGKCSLKEAWLAGCTGSADR